MHHVRDTTANRAPPGNRSRSSSSSPPVQQTPVATGQLSGASPSLSRDICDTLDTLRATHVTQFHYSPRSIAGDTHPRASMRGIGAAARLNSFLVTSPSAISRETKERSPITISHVPFIFARGFHRAPRNFSKANHERYI